MTTDSTFHRLKLGFTWCYLLKCHEGYLLIDTSYPKYMPKFQKSIAGRGINLSEIKYLLLTHHHDDHAGFASELVEKTGCRIIVHHHAAGPLKQGESEDTMRPVNRRVKFTFSLFSLFHRHFRFPPLVLGKNDMLVKGDDSDVLKNIGIDGKIVYTPGHSRDSISVVLSGGTAFVGDVAMNFLRFTGIRHRPIFVEDINTVYESWEKLKDQGARIINPSHGYPFSVQELVRC